MSKSVWIVQAEAWQGDAAVEGPGTFYTMAFSTRDAAHEVYWRGVRELPQYLWSLEGVPLDDEAFANEMIDNIREELKQGA